MKICIFCGASDSRDPKVLEEANKVMQSFHENNIELIYGGAAIGVMGALANRLMVLGGKAQGVIPRQLMKKEIAHAGLSELHVVPDMHARKKMMYDLSDAFLIFPGGMGTMDELFEILTWRQLGFHNKPIALMNINGYFDHLLTFLDHTVNQGLVKPKDRSLVFSSNDWNTILTYFQENQK
ncbi:MAG: TIGR00730 family Rossman fold protein [Bdellovibrionota bacterium]